MIFLEFNNSNETLYYNSDNLQSIKISKKSLDVDYAITFDFQFEEREEVQLFKNLDSSILRKATELIFRKMRESEAYTILNVQSFYDHFISGGEDD